MVGFGSRMEFDASRIGWTAQAIASSKAWASIGLRKKAAAPARFAAARLCSVSLAVMKITGDLWPCRASIAGSSRPLVSGRRMSATKQACSANLPTYVSSRTVSKDLRAHPCRTHQACQCLPHRGLVIDDVDGDRIHQARIRGWSKHRTIAARRRLRYRTLVLCGEESAEHLA